METKLPEVLDKPEYSGLKADVLKLSLRLVNPQEFLESVRRYERVAKKKTDSLRLVIAAPPGAGKSTVMRQLAVVVGEVRKTSPNVPGIEEIQYGNEMLKAIQELKEQPESAGEFKSAYGMLDAMGWDYAKEKQNPGYAGEGRDEMRKLIADYPGLYKHIQTKASERIAKLCSDSNKIYIINTHCTIYNEQIDKYVIGLPPHVINPLKLDAIILLEVDRGEFVRRILADKTRKRDPEAVVEQMDLNMVFARMLAVPEIANIAVKTASNPKADKPEDAGLQAAWTIVEKFNELRSWKITIPEKFKDN